MIRYELLKVSELVLDRENPRIQAALEMYDEIDDVKIGMALGANAAQFEGQGITYQSLRDSIKTHGGIFNPIIVNRMDDGTNLVIEGNTRVHIYRDFIKNGVPGSWDIIPAMIYENSTKEEMDAVRLQAHLVGPRDWDAYSKAKYLHKLSEIDKMPINQIIDYCGGKKKDIQQYIIGYKLMEEFYRPILSSDSEFEKTKFTAFIEVQKSNIQNILLANNFTLTDFAKWVYDGKFDRLEDIRKIPRIFANQKAKKIFLLRGSKVALKELDKPIDSVPLDQIPISKLFLETSRRIRSLEFDQLRQFSEDSEFINKTNDLYDEVNYLIEYLNQGQI